jgi:hypothetical protein
MKGMRYTFCFITVAAFFGACNKTDVYEQKAKTLDSLNGAVNSVIRELQNMDTIILQKSVTRFNWYKQFIRQNVNDTISKMDADNLQHFYASGQNLENFLQNRKIILTRAGQLNAQLLKLSEDIKSKRLNVEYVSKYSFYEKEEAGKLIEAGSQQRKIFHISLEEYKNSLKGVELLIRSRNNGELPTIIKDTVAL